MGVTERPRSLNPSKAVAMAICPIIVHFSTWRARSMHDVACDFARAAVRSKDAQKQLARTSLRWLKTVSSTYIGWVVITTTYHLMLQSWYQKTSQSLVNTLSSFF